MIILIDWNIFVFRSIFAWESAKEKSVPPTYTALSMLLGTLKRIHCHPDDTFILAIDSPMGSWRKKIDNAYKANRKADREKHDIDWKQMFRDFDQLVQKIDRTSPFHVMKIDYMEADDIIATACKYFKDDEVVIISSDSDYEMLVAYPNVKVFSPSKKKYKEIANPYKVLASKIEKETADNLITPINTKEDYDRRLKIVDLIHLPTDIEEIVLSFLTRLKDKDYDLSQFPFKTLRNRFMQIYDEKPKRRNKNEDCCIF